jgi:L-serine dehydratase
MAFISVFEVLGPNMIGPSSSHTAGAAAIAYLAQKMLADKVCKVEFVLYGSFAKTYHGHGTDRALLGGIMGFDTEDERIRDSFEIADEIGLEYQFYTNEEETDIHPNTVDIRMVGVSGRTMTVRGESVGGGKVQITRMNSVKIHFTGEYSAVIVTHQDRPGVVSHITKCLSDHEVNIAFMRLFREDKGKTAYTIVESDGVLPQEVAAEIEENPYVSEVVVVEP